MTTKLHNESRRHYSWWWVSHISPKNSKWLQENLADADMKVNTIIKLLEEDADSFARRAEMYYKKRPELMKLVEELYRAYRALAEKYDHATGALRQAHRTMAEAFPNQIPLLLSDESPCASSGSEAEPHTPEAPPPLRALFDPDDLTRDALGFSTELHVIKRNGAYSEPNDSLSNKKGLKQLNEMFEIGDETACTSEGRVRKGLNFQGEEGESPENKTLKCSREQNQVKEKPDFSQLSAERENLKNQIMAETDRANKAINELQSLKDTMSKLTIEKDLDKSQYQMSQQKITLLESELSAAHDELKKLNDEMARKVRKLQGTEEINQSLALEIEMLTNKAKLLEHELKQKQEELEKLHITIEENHQKCKQMEKTLYSKEKLHTQSQDEVNHLSQEIKKEIQKLRDMELCNADLQEQICKLKEEIEYLHGQNLPSTSMIDEFKDRIALLEKKNRVLEEEVQFHRDKKDILNQEFFHVKEDRINLQKKYQDLMGQKDLVDVHLESLEMVIKSLQNENSELKVISKKHEDEKVLLVEELKDKENILERNAVLENSLSDASLELNVLREKILSLEDLHGSLNGEISTSNAEKKALVSQSESLTQDVNILSEKNLLLEKSLSDINIEVGYLRSKLKDLEESSRLLNAQNSDLLAERNDLLGQIETLTQKVGKHLMSNSLLERSLSDVGSEIQWLKSTLTESEESCQTLTDQNSDLFAERNTLLSRVKIVTEGMEKLLDEKSSLENSLYDVGSEVVGLRAKLKDSEESCHSLSHQNSGLLAERNSLFSQVGVFTQNMEKLSHKNASLEDSLSDVNNEVESLRSKLKDFEESCHSLSCQNSALLAEKSSLLSQVEVLTEDMEKLSHKNASLENSVSDVNNEVESLRSKLKDFEESCHSLSHQNSGLIAERSSLVSQVEVFTHNMENVLQKNASLENYVSDVNKEVESLRSKLKDCEESCQSLRDQNSDILAERNSLLSQLETHTQNMEKLSEKNSLLEDSLSDVRSEVYCLRSKLKDSEESCKSLNDQSSCLLTERANLVSQLEALTQNVGKLSDKNYFLENSVTDLGSKVECLRSQLKDLEESCQSLTNKNSDLLAEKNTLESQIEALTQNVEKLSERNSILENSLFGSSNEVGCLKSKLKESKESYQSLSEQNSILLAEISALVSQAEVLTQNVEQLSSKNCLLENSLTAVSTEVRGLRFKLKDFEESCKSLSEENTITVAEKNTLLSQVAILAHNVEKVSEKNSFLENSLSEASAEVEHLKSKLKDSEASCESLEDQISNLLAERNNLISQVKDLTNNAENLLDKNSFLEVSLSSISTEVECLRSKLKDFKDSFQSLSDQNSYLIAERNNLLSQLETITQEKEKLLEKCSILVNSLSDASTEVESLKLKLEDSKEYCSSLTDQNSGLLAERSNLLSQVEVLTINVENLSETNSFFKNSLYDANSEVELLRSKLKDFEDSYQLLSYQNSSLLDERNTILSQLEILTHDAEKLSDENSFLENSLSAVNSEVGVLKSKLKNYEESYQSLHSQNSSLLTERSTLVSQVESITLNLESLENSFLELKHTNFKLSEERDLMISQVKDLQDLLKLEKENHEDLVQSFKGQLAALENQIFLLRQENQLKEQELEAQQSSLVDALIENFILQRCLCDVNSRNLALSIECQKNLQSCRNAEVLTSQLEQEKLIHIKNIATLSERNQKLSSGICFLQNSLIVDKVYGFSDEIPDEVGLDIVVKNILTFVSEAEYDNQLLHLEISVLITLLKHTMLDVARMRLEKFSLERELGNRTKELLALRTKEHELLVLHENLKKGLEASNNREIELKTEMKVLCLQLTDLQESLQRYKCEIQDLLEEKKILMEEIYHLSQKHDVLEEENREVLAEAMKLDHLCLFYRSLSADRLLELKSFAYDLDSLHFVKNNLLAEVDKLKSRMSVLKGENRHLMDSLTCLEEEFRNHLLLSEFDLITIAWVCEELDIETQSTEKQLIHKQLQLSETHQDVQSTQLKNMELCKIIERLQLDIETGKLVREGLEHKISNFSEGVAQKCEEIRCLCEANEMLREELFLKHGEVDVLASRGEDFLSELKKERDENERCEGEIELLLSEIQVSTIDAALYKEKLQKLAIEEEVCSMLQKEVLVMEITLIKEYADSLKKKLDHLEGESLGLKVDLNAYASLVTSLWNDIISLEQQIVGMAKLGLSNDPDRESRQVSHLHHDDSQSNEGHEGMNIEGVSTLKKLITKVKSLQKVMTEIQMDRDQGDLDDGSNSVVAGKGIKGPEKNENGWPQEVQLSLNSTKHSEDGRNDASSKGKSGQTMKDIQLDQDSRNLPIRSIGSYGLSRINNDEIDDQLWEAAERNCSNQRPKASTVAREQDIEPAEEVKSEYPSSELMVEKELSIDKLEIPNKALTTRPEWNRRLLGRLKTDAQRLSDLKTSVAELKRKMEGSQMGKLPASFGYDTIKSQLTDAEASAAELIEGNKKLTSKAEEYLRSDGPGAKSEESSSSTGRRQLSEQARRESDKIGRLELELHKIQYVLQKLEEEQGSRHANPTEGRARTLLRDYIYGRRDGRGMKKRGLCGCMRPETKGNL